MPAAFLWSESQNATKSKSRDVQAHDKPKKTMFITLGKTDISEQLHRVQPECLTSFTQWCRYTLVSFFTHEYCVMQSL